MPLRCPATSQAVQLKNYSLAFPPIEQTSIFQGTDTASSTHLTLQPAAYCAYACIYVAVHPLPVV